MLEMLMLSLAFDLKLMSKLQERYFFVTLHIAGLYQLTKCPNFRKIKLRVLNHARHW